jgi:hypothetical protein
MKIFNPFNYHSTLHASIDKIILGDASYVYSSHAARKE